LLDGGGKDQPASEAAKPGTVKSKTKE